MMVRLRNKKWHIRIRQTHREMWFTCSAKGKREAEWIAAAVKTAIKTRDFAALDNDSAEACLRLFRNQGWQIPPELLPSTNDDHGIRALSYERLSLWDAIEICLSSPGIRESSNRVRNEQSFIHVLKRFGEDFPIKDLWIKQIKDYQVHRQQEGAAASTINKEKAALSLLFQSLVEQRLLERNPAREVRNLSEKAGERHEYVSYRDYKNILDLLPTWLRPVVQIAYYSGMRRGEIAESYQRPN